MREIGMKLFHRADQIDEEQLMKAQALLLWWTIWQVYMMISKFLQ
jgi:hypothetical protein